MSLACPALSMLPELWGVVREVGQFSAVDRIYLAWTCKATRAADPGPEYLPLFWAVERECDAYWQNRAVWPWLRYWLRYGGPRPWHVETKGKTISVTFSLRHQPMPREQGPEHHLLLVFGPAMDCIARFYSCSTCRESSLAKQLFDPGSTGLARCYSWISWPIQSMWPTGADLDQALATCAPPEPPDVPFVNENGQPRIRHPDGSVCCVNGCGDCGSCYRGCHYCS